MLALPFERGTTFFGNTTPDANVGVELEGLVYEVPDWDYSQSGAKTLRTRGKTVKLMVVRNVATIALAPKRIVTPALAAVYGCRVNGYILAPAVKGWVVDEWLPAAGVAVNDLFYVVIGGPSMTTIPSSNLTASLAIGDFVGGMTSAASTDTTAGRIDSINTNVATTVLANTIKNTIGRAMSAAVSGTATANSDLLVDVGA